MASNCGRSPFQAHLRFPDLFHQRDDLIMIEVRFGFGFLRFIFEQRLDLCDGLADMLLVFLDEFHRLEFIGLFIEKFEVIIFAQRILQIQFKTGHSRKDVLSHHIDQSQSFDVDGLVVFFEINFIP